MMPDHTERNLTIDLGPDYGTVPALLLHPPEARALLVLAHGAGAGMRHRFMEAIASALADRGIATFRYQFPYMEAGGGRPDSPKVLTATVRAAVAAASSVAPGLAVFAGGKSLGGRMTSTADSQAPLPGVWGLIFLGFPLHAPKRPGEARADHLVQVQLPMLFLQGTRDDLAQLDLITGVCQRLGRRATLHVVQGGNHSFEVLKRSGRTNAEVLEELAETAVNWMDEVRI